MDIQPGDYRLEVSCVGYEPVTSTVHLDYSETKDVEVTLTRDGARTVEMVSVRATADPSGRCKWPVLLNRADIQNLGTVIADDLLRAVQAVPGATSNDDFGAQFSLRGADFSRVGVYLDDVLLHNPIHGLEGTDLSDSAGILNMSTVRHIALFDDPYSELFADSSAAVLDLSMRDGSRDGYHVRMSANVAAARVEMEGPVSSKCSWIGAFRKTYIKYLIAKTLTVHLWRLSYRTLRAV